jgi:hypothetical protein
MVDLFMLPADYGDCLWLEYDDDAKRSRMLVDCGTAATWPRLRQRIEALPLDQRHFALLVITHIDNDHIGGAIPLLKAREELRVTFGEIWFNSAKHLVPDALGVKDGDKLTNLLGNADLERVWNASFNGGAVCVPVSGKLPSFSFGRLSLTLLSPSPTQLQRLSATWAYECSVAGLANDDLPGESNTELTEPDDVLGEEPDIATLLAMNPKMDKAVANGSSIAFLAEVGDWRGFFGADAFPAVLINSLERLDTPGPHKLDVFKTPHHGSKGNITAELLAHFECAHYLFSSNGDKFGHPDRAAVARVIADKSAKTLHFNYRSEKTVYWERPEIRSEYGFDVAFSCDTAYKIS